MELSEAARGARHDQARAAQAEVVAILGSIAGQRERWNRIDECTQARIETLLRQVLANDADEDRVCSHARRGAFDRAPRPLVLDTTRGILACSDGCYGRRVSPEVTDGRVTGTCFDCGRRLDHSGQDLFIAYGPILLAGALCMRCRSGARQGSATEHGQGAS